MARKKTVRLDDKQKEFIVQRLACYDTPSEVAAAFKDEYGMEVAPQRVEAYDPTKRIGKDLSQKWRTLFEATRKGFLEHVEHHLPEANKAVRVRHLIHAARAYKSRGNYVGMADMLERVAKELGNVHTNRRELSGRDGKPIEFSDLTDEQLDSRLAGMLEALGVTGFADDHDGEGAGDVGGSNSVH